jgi:hypothetical protein
VAQARGAAGPFDALVTDGLLLDGTAEDVGEAVRARARLLLAGTDTPSRPGFQKVLLKPAPATQVGEAIRACLAATS